MIPHRNFVLLWINLSLFTLYLLGQRTEGVNARLVCLSMIDKAASSPFVDKESKDELFKAAPTEECIPLFSRQWESSALVF